MNNRTDCLIQYSSAILTKSKKFDRVQKLKTTSSNPEELIIAKEEEEKASQEVVKIKEIFELHRSSLTKEMVRFEKERVRDLREAMKNFAQMQIDYTNDTISLITNCLGKLDVIKTV